MDVWAVRRGNALTVLLTNHALPRQPLAAQRVRIELTDAPAARAVTVERIDDNHANAKAAWRAMGRPEYLDDVQLEMLQEASRLVAGPFPCAVEGIHRADSKVTNRSRDH